MSERTSRTEERKALGERLRRTARAAGLTSDKVAEALGIQGGSVRGWWVGRNEPSFERLKKYAALVNVSANYLLLGSEEAMGPVGTLEEWRLRYADLIAKGVSPEEAVDQISGPPQSAEEEMTDEEHALLIGSGPAMRAALEQHSEGRWEELTQEQRAAVLSVIRAMAKSNRPEDKPPDDAASG